MENDEENLRNELKRSGNFGIVLATSIILEKLFYFLSIYFYSLLLVVFFLTIVEAIAAIVLIVGFITIGQKLNNDFLFFGGIFSLIFGLIYVFAKTTSSPSTLVILIINIVANLVFAIGILKLREFFGNISFISGFIEMLKSFFLLLVVGLTAYRIIISEIVLNSITDILELSAAILESIILINASKKAKDIMKKWKEEIQKFQP